MRESVAHVVSILLFVLPAFAQNGSIASGSIRGDVFTKGTNGEPAVVPGAQIVLRGPVTRERPSRTHREHSLSMAFPRGHTRSRRMLPACMRHSRWNAAPAHLPPFQSK